MKKFLFFLCLLLSFSSYAQEKRLALVIGNSNYQHGGILKNPVNDAYAMNRALSQVGFEVLEYFNLNQTEMKKAIDDFGRKLKSNDVGLFFYAGHGIQTGGDNYLIPIEANLASEQDVEYDCIEANRVLGKMDASGAAVNIIILDACRNNPFERSWNRSANGHGLAFMNAPTGTLIAYATAPGSTASDGTGMNGLYTSAILKSMDIPNLTIIQMFQNVRTLVTQDSDDRQTPWESTSLIGDFYLNQDRISNNTEIAEESNDDVDSEPSSSSISNKEASEQSFSRTGLMLQSIALPGLGLTRKTGKPHWIKGVTGYGLAAGSVVFNKMAINSYNDFLSANDTEFAENKLSQASSQDLISEIFAYSAISIWVSEIIWTFAATSDLKKMKYTSEKIGLSVGADYDTYSRSPLLAFRFTF